MCVCACVRACVRACVYVCVCFASQLRHKPTYSAIRTGQRLELGLDHGRNYRRLRTPTERLLDMGNQEALCLCWSVAIAKNGLCMYQGRTQRCCYRVGTESRSLEPSGESCEGGGGYDRGDEPTLIGGVRGPPPENFSKSMYLRTHFKPF